MSNDLEQLQAIQDALGPRRVKTPELEVEQYNLNDLMKAKNQTGGSGTKPFLHNLAWTKVVPKNGCSCEDVQQGGCCRE